MGSKRSMETRVHGTCSTSTRTGPSTLTGSDTFHWDLISTPVQLLVLKTFVGDMTYQEAQGSQCPALWTDWKPLQGFWKNSVQKNINMASKQRSSIGKWLHVTGKVIVRSYQSKLFTVVRTKVLVKGKSLSGNSPKHGPKMINTGIKPRRVSTAFSGAAGFYHFINSVNVCLSFRNENFLEGRWVNEKCSNSSSIFTVCLRVAFLFLHLPFFLKTLKKINVRYLDSALAFVFTNEVTK